MKQNKKVEYLPSLDEIIFSDIDIKSTFKNRNIIREWIKKTIQKEGYKLNILNYNFCTDEKLLEINKEFLQHDYYTDIITFQLSEDKNITGDIYISLDRVKENAKFNKTTYTNELMRVIIHGVLHLCGYKDKTTKDQKLMREKEDYYISLL
jgi:probable rRNA maturation factor